MNTTGLEVSALTIRYGAHTAVDAVSFSAPIGRLTGLIGPNGAGKTTTFNACSGLLTPAQGRISFMGYDITRLSTPARARRGIGRTFQRMELFSSMTVAENISLGREAALGGANPFRQLLSSRGQRDEVAEAADEAIRLCGLERLASRPVGELSTGQRRLVELARACAGRHRMLLLDEPSAGLDHAESEHFGSILQRLIAERDLGILLVEHDMALVMSICEYLYVLDFGELIFEGTAAETHDSPVVRAAYLGADDVLDVAAKHGVAHARH